MSPPSTYREETPESDAGSPSRHESDQQPARKRQRIRLSCRECRRRKLSCDRGFPCVRCIRSHTADQCSYESRDGAVVTALAGVSSGYVQLDTRRFGLRDGMIGSSPDADAMRQGDDHERIRRLEMELAQIKGHLSRSGAVSLNGSTVAGSGGSPATTQKDETHADQRPLLTNTTNNTTTTNTSTTTTTNTCAASQQGEQQQQQQQQQQANDKGELRFFRGKGFRTRYFGPHNASTAFVELTGLCPFMRETADEWLRPVILQDHKDRKRRQEDRETQFEQRDLGLEALLPAREEADALVSVYLDHFEQVHRIVHIPTFRKEYAEYWAGQRNAAFTALILSMMAVSSCVRAYGAEQPLKLKFVGRVSSARRWADRWICACDAWSGRQSQKHRRLIHYQVACLLYLGKRVNTIKKKRFWTSSGALIQDGIAVGLHREPSHMGGKISVYNQEMRRRIWATVQEFDMQASFDHGLPTLVSQLHYDTNPPRNLDDGDFDENTTRLPPSRPPREYTFSSFQHLSRQSLLLRLELSRLLTGPVSEIDYDQVIRYTNDLTQEIDALPSWDMSMDASPGEAAAASAAAADGYGDGDGDDGDKSKNTNTNTNSNPKRSKKIPLIAYTLLHIQLRQYIIPLHQPYLKLRKENSKYQYSELIYYNAARDIVLLHDKLHEQGIRALNFLREDALTTAINLCSVTMLQPRGSTNMIMINSPHTLKLIEKCISMKEDRLLRCGNNEPWGYSIMCAALGLLEAHLGTKTAEEAKASSAERFVSLHHKMLANQELTTALVEPSATATATGGGAAICTGGLGGDGIAPSGLDMAAKAAAPFAFAPSMSSVPVDASASQPWGLGDQTQLFNLEPSLELLGLNLNEMWGESWELG